MRERLGELIEEMLEKGIELRLAVREFENLYIQKGLERSEGVLTRAADALGIHRNTLRSKMVAKGKPARKKSRKRKRG